mgnify:CR=1 FL=1
MLLLAKPNNPADIQRFVLLIFLTLVDPQVGHFGIFSPLFLKAVLGSAPVYIFTRCLIIKLHIKIIINEIEELEPKLLNI